MKFKLIYSFLIFSLFIVSCQKEQKLNENKVKNATSQNNILIELFKKMSFKEDFIGNSHGIISTSSKFFFEGDLSKISYETFLVTYPNFKAKLNQLNSIDFLQESGNIQETVLRMLRYQFLKQETKESVNETRFLLNVLINHEAKDLDILVDAFVKVKNSLIINEKNEIKQYIANLYSSEKEHVYKNFPVMKQKYQSEKDLSKKHELLFLGIYLEKRSQAAAYAKQVIPDLD